MEEPSFTADYHDPSRRSISNALQVELHDGRRLDEVLIEYPVGHARRRSEGRPLLEAKFRRNLARRFPGPRQQAILEASADRARLEQLAVNEYVDLYVTVTPP